MDDFDPTGTFLSIPTPTGSILDDVFDNGSSFSDCFYVVPDENGHVPWGSCRGYYLYYPSQAGNAIFAVLFGLAAMIHFQQMCHYRKARSPTEEVTWHFK